MARAALLAKDLQEERFDEAVTIGHLRQQAERLAGLCDMQRFGHGSGLIGQGVKW